LLGNCSDAVGQVALELLRAFAPPRPVRLLGVRVAGLNSDEAAEAQQLMLAV
jgi:DNA polymerase IV